MNWAIFFTPSRRFRQTPIYKILQIFGVDWISNLFPDIASISGSLGWIFFASIVFVFLAGGQIWLCCLNVFSQLVQNQSTNDDLLFFSHVTPIVNILLGPLYCKPRILMLNLKLLKNHKIDKVRQILIQ